MKSNLCDYSKAKILVKGTMIAPNTAGAVEAVYNTKKKLIFKNCTPFTNCIREIYNIQVDDAQHIDTAMYLYDLEYRIQ